MVKCAVLIEGIGEIFSSKGNPESIGEVFSVEGR